MLVTCSPVLRLAQLGDGLSAFVHQLHIGAGLGHADAAGELLGRDRVAADHGAGFRQAIAFDDGAAGLFQPQLGHGALHGHAAPDRDLQVAPVHAVEVRVMGQPVEQGVHRREVVEDLALQVLEHRFQVARIGDQDVAPAGVHGQHHVHREREDMVERQRADAGDLLARLADVLQHRVEPGFALQRIGDDVAMQQHRTLADAGGAAGVLQHGNVLGPHRHRHKAAAAALGHGGLVAHGAGQLERGHQLLDLAHHIVDQQALEAQLIAHAAQHHMLHRRLGDALLQRVGEVFDDDDGLGAGVLELVLQFAGGVERVDVHHHIAGAQNGSHGHRVLRHIGHHDGHAVALFQAQRLQVGGKRLALPVHMAERNVLAHIGVGRAIGIGLEGLFHQRHQRGVARRVDICWHAFGIGCQPWTLCRHARGLHSVLF